MNYFKTLFSAFLISVPFSQTSLLASDLIIAQNFEDEIEVIAKKKVRKNGTLVVKFCDELKDFSGYVTVNNQKFSVENADKIKSKKVVWKNTNLPKLKGESINTSNLLARYEEEDNQEPLKVLNNGNCGGLGILPLVIVGAGIAAGAGGSGSGTSSSN